MAIRTRDGKEVRIILVNDKGIEKELTQDEVKIFALNIHKNILSILSKIVLRPNYYLTIIKSIIKMDRVRIRRSIRAALLDFNYQHIRLYFGAKKIDIIDQGRGISEIESDILANQYDINEKNVKNKTIIDAGANRGDFSLYAALLGAKRVYAFEPVKETYETLVKNIELNKMENVIIPINKALGNKNEMKEINYSGAGDLEATLNEKRLNPKEKPRKIKALIEITTLDNFVKENNIKKVDFIKMDVEGYEENVLLGAKETIKKFKPILSFSAYHLPTDKERLPQIVKSIRPDYKIKLNHFCEEDFYCE